MDSTTLLACNRRYIVSAAESRITTRRTNEGLTLLKPDYDEHKGKVTHLAIHQQDHCYGTQDDWGRVVASSDVTNRVKVWLCDGEEEELLFARNMAEYVGYEKVSALAWTADSKVAIGDMAGNFIVFNARFATSRYNRTVPKAIIAIAPSHADPHIHAVGYVDGSILLIRTNPSFQILFTNSVAHTGPIVSLAWRPEFSAPRTYTEKDGKVHKSSAEDMALLASCPTTKGEFRIWAWSSKNEKLSGFRDEKPDAIEGAGSPSAVGGLHWSRNGKVVQFIEGEVHIWDVKKLQIQSELFIPASKKIIGIAVDGYRGIIYTLDSNGVYSSIEKANIKIEKHMIPAKTNYQVPPKSVAAPVTEETSTPATSAPSPSRTPPPATESSAAKPEPVKVSVVSIPTPTLPTSEPSADLKPTPTIERTPSIDSLSKVKQMARQIDEDPGLARKRSTQNNFIANAKHKYSFERRKRTISNDDLLPRRVVTESPEQRTVESGSRSVSSTGANSGVPARGPSIFDIAMSGIPRLQGKTTSEIKENIGGSKFEASSRSRSPSDTRKATIPEQTDLKPVTSEEPKVIPIPQPSPSFKPMETIRRTDTPPISISIPTSSTAPLTTATQSSQSSAINPQHSFMSPVVDRLMHESDFTESPVLGEAMSIPHPPAAEPASPTPSIPDSPIASTAFPLETIVEETPALRVKKDNAITAIDSILEEKIHAKFTPPVQQRGMPSRPAPPRTTSDTSLTEFSTPPSSSSTSSKLAEPTSSYEDLGGISMDDHSFRDDAGSDTSIEPMDTTKPLNTIIIPEIPITPQPTTTTFSSPTTPPKTPSRASKIWAEKGKNIHVQHVEYLSDDEEEEASPMYQPAPPQSAQDGGLDSPTPYKHSLRDYDLFRDLTRRMSRESKERLEFVLSTKLDQRNVADALFGMEIRDVVKRELEFVRSLNIGLSELILKLWLGKEIDDEALLKAILFGKNNGLSDALVLTIAPLAGIEAWESLTLWCSESCSNAKSNLSNSDIVKGNALARTHLYAGFLCYNGSWIDAAEVYRKAKMYREGILMALMAISAGDANEEVLVDSLKSQFRSWGDQVAAQEGDGLLVSMCFAASMMTFIPSEPTPKPRKPNPIDYEDYEPSSSRSSPSSQQLRKVSDPIKSKSPVIPVIRTQKPSPTETESSRSQKGSLNGPDSPHGRNWSELASFMKKQKEKGYSEIRAPKTVQFKDEEKGSPRVKPVVARPRLPSDTQQRFQSPAGRQIPVRRHTDDDDYSRRPRRPSLKNQGRDAEDTDVLSPVPRKPAMVSATGQSSSSGDRRRPHEMSSPLTFGARGSNIKPYITDPPPIPSKDEKRDKARENEKKYDYGVGLGIQHGVRERRA